MLPGRAWRLKKLAPVGILLLTLFTGLAGASQKSMAGPAIRQEEAHSIYLPFVHQPVLNAMVVVPAGPFQMGCSPDDTLCSADELPLHTVSMSAYALDRYQVTNVRYAACVAAGGCTPPPHTHSATRPAYYGNPACHNDPVLYVSWSQAAAFCSWEGKRLPSEAEWEKAARGSRDTRIYPWGSRAPDCTLANFFLGDSTGYCVGDTSTVGSYPAGAGPYGTQDMAGNAWEWVNDWYAGDYYHLSPTADPPGPAAGSSRVLRGGTWSSGWYFIRSSVRSWNDPGSGSYEIGFRCARTIER